MNLAFDWVTRQSILMSHWTSIHTQNFRSKSVEFYGFFNCRTIGKLYRLNLTVHWQNELSKISFQLKFGRILPEKFTERSAVEKPVEKSKCVLNTFVMRCYFMVSSISFIIISLRTSTLCTNFTQVLITFYSGNPVKS